MSQVQDSNIIFMTTMTSNKLLHFRKFVGVSLWNLEQTRFLGVDTSPYLKNSRNTILYWDITNTNILYYLIFKNLSSMLKAIKVNIIRIRELEKMYDSICDFDCRVARGKLDWGKAWISGVFWKSSQKRISILCRLGHFIGWVVRKYFLNL